MTPITDKLPRLPEPAGSLLIPFSGEAPPPGFSWQQMVAYAREALASQQADHFPDAKKMVVADSVGVPEGFVLVPVEPTPEMLRAAVDATVAALHADEAPIGQDDLTRVHWAAMLTAAPAAPQAAPAGPVAWTLRETLDKRETTCSARLWFVDPKNSGWAPLYATPPIPGAEPGQDARDAERYRWLRDEAWGGNNKRGPYLVEFKPGYMPSAVTLLAEEAADAAIDAALAARGEQR